MPVDYYPQKSVAELVVILEKLQKRQTEGLLGEVAAAGIRTTRDIGRGAGNSRPEVEIKRVLYSLYRRAKGTGEADNWPNPYNDMIRRTLPSYGGPAYS
jgi:hypothetical protein